VAIKIIPRTAIDRFVIEEVQNLSKCHHPQIIQFREVRLPSSNSHDRPWRVSKHVLKASVILSKHILKASVILQHNRGVHGKAWESKSLATADRRACTIWVVVLVVTPVLCTPRKFGVVGKVPASRGSIWTPQGPQQIRRFCSRRLMSPMPTWP